WSERTQQSKNKDSIHLLDFKYTNGGEISDQEAIKNAINFCFMNKRTLDWDGIYINVSENIINFWNINHTGVGGIVSSNQKFHITPRNAEISTIFVSPTGTPDGDGLSLATATTHAKAFIYLSTISSRGLDGNWRIRYSAGFYNSEGVRIQQNLPIFKNRLQIIGEPVNTTENEIPKTIFTGDQSILGYWIHCENNVNFLRLHFKDIKVQNYKSGGIIIWDAHNVLAENIHLNNMPTGAGYRNGYARHNNGVVSNCEQGLGFAYIQRANVGTLSGGGVIFDNNNISVNLSRSAVAYIQGSKFDRVKNVAIEVNRNARIRTQGNNFSSFNETVISATYIQCSMTSTYNPDNASNPDSYAGLTNSKKAYQQFTGGYHPFINSGTQQTVHLISDSTGLTLSGTDLQLLSSTRADYVPFRLPAYALYNDSFKLRCEILVRMHSNSGGVLYLLPAHSNVDQYLARAVIPIQPNTKDLKIELEVYSNPQTNQIRYDITCHGVSLYVAGAASGTSLNGSGIRAQTDTRLLYRLFWKGATEGSVEFRSMRTYVEI
ncbi:hypothetical protein, partial [Acinetobacter proteolyticus]|uniref:hypothetical protein n=1 Tax=Acinetobacter proteolyticus TaxID=1776741 RepID=UPI001359C075